MVQQVDRAPRGLVRVYVSNSDLTAVALVLVGALVAGLLLRYVWRAIRWQSG